MLKMWEKLTFSEKTKLKTYDLFIYKYSSINKY